MVLPDLPEHLLGGEVDGLVEEDPAGQRDDHRVVDGLPVVLVIWPAQAESSGPFGIKFEKFPGDQGQSIAPRTDDPCLMSSCARVARVSATASAASRW